MEYELPITEYDGAPDMPQLHTPAVDGQIIWPLGQQVRLLWPDQCTRCLQGRQIAPRFIGLVSIYQPWRNSGQWIHYCPHCYQKRSR